MSAAQLAVCPALCDLLHCFPGGSVVKSSPANAGDSGDLRAIPGSGRSPGGGSENPLQYFYLGTPMDRRAWWAAVPLCLCSVMSDSLWPHRLGWVAISCLQGIFLTQGPKLSPVSPALSGSFFTTSATWEAWRGEGPWNTGWLVFMAWVVSSADKWEEHSNQLGGGVGIFQNGATTHFWAFLSLNYPGPCGCVI